MLRFLRITNFALAENLEVEFQPGLNILTGETGAGKSILVGAISAVLGGRVFTEVVRTGFEKGWVEGIFDISKIPAVQRALQEKGLPVAGGELILRREISVKGQTRGFINDRPVTVGTLAEIGNFLVDIHGQHEHQSLFRPETHLLLLDSLAQSSGHLKEVARHYETVRHHLAALAALKKRQDELKEKYELYAFQLKEIRDLELVPGEDESLEAERKRLANAGKLNELSSLLLELLNGESGGILSGLAEAERHLTELRKFAVELETIAQEFSSARIVVEELNRSIENFQGNIEFNPLRQEEVENRLNQINLAKKKYGESIEDILKFAENLEKTLSLRENYQFELQKLEKSYLESVEKYSESSLKLSEHRRRAARELEKKVQQELVYLGMEKARFHIYFQKTEDLNGLCRLDGKLYRGDERGIDQVEYHFSANPGEAYKPLHKIASGGEISRVMLALKSILAESDKIPTLIFDEIDNGVSGRIAQSVGHSIRNLAASHQTLCITHLPQIAAQQGSHYRVEKFIDKGRTFTRIIPLGEAERIEEIARLMSGNRVSESALQSARSLIEENSRAAVE